MGKKVLFKTIGALLLITALLVTQIPAKEVNADTSKKTEFQLDGDTLVKYTGTATTVSVPSGVKVIGEEAFLNNTNLVTLKLSDSVEKISYAAFSGCENLKELIVNDKCEEIESAAFANCTNLKKVTLGKGISKLGSAIFVGCRKITSFKINSNKFIISKKNVIYNKDKTKLIEAIYTSEITSLNIPDSVTVIYPYAFYGCNNLKDITLSTNLEEIQAYSFSNCYGINSITLPYSVDNIDAKAFENCINLEKITIPESVSYIHETAFDGCPKLTVDAPTWSYAYKWFQKFIPSDASIIDYEDNDAPIEFETSTSDNTVSGNDYTVKEDGLSQTKIVGRNAVFFIDNTALTVSEKNNEEVVPEENDNNEDKGDNSSNEISSIPAIDLSSSQTDNKGAYIPKFAIVNDKVASKAFYGDSSLTEYTVSDNVKSIGDFSFARSALEKVNLPDGLEKIGYGAFYHCDNLKTIDIPSSVKEIEPSAFEHTAYLENWNNDLQSSYLIVGDGILLAYKGQSATVEIPEKVKSIGPAAFKNNKNIVTLKLNENIETIGEEAFAGCSNLKYVSGGQSLKVIKDRAFEACPIETVKINDSVLQIGLDAFDLSKTGVEESSKVVVFEGSVLPSVSYEKTTSRLTNSHYRVNALNDFNLAIIENEDVNLINSVLDYKNLGFSGLIGIITDRSDSDDTGHIKIISSTLTADEAKDFETSSFYCVNGKKYSVDADEVNKALAESLSGVYDIKDNDNARTFDGDNTQYILSVKEVESADMKAAYERVYGIDLSKDYHFYDVTLKTNGNNIEITKLGRQSLEIAIKLEEDLNKDNLHVISLDSDGQLEDISYSLSEGSSSSYVFFDITHTGTYGIYSGEVSNLLPGDLDISPDTGDGIHPKWFLALGLFLASIAMFLIKVK